jgi:outer membrane protein insertion porin family
MRVISGWRLVVFLDAGNVYPKISDIDPTDLRYAAGLGLRYSTPVGPVRVDYGHKLDKKPGESSGEIHFSIGHAF